MGYMKNVVKISIITCMAMSVSSASMSNFLQNNLGTSITSENSGYYKSQASGFLSGGSVRIRWGGGENIRPFNVTVPSFNVGCSGIDMVFGGFSYLNFEYLVEKLKKIAAAAPAFAFQIALSTLCKDCQTIMSELEKIANAINSMNFDTCQMTKNWSKHLGDVLSTNNQTGLSNSWISSFSAAAEGTRKEIDKFVNYINNGPSNPNDEKNSVKILKQGSLIRKIMEKGKDAFFAQAFGQAGVKDSEYETLLRALFGDFYAYTKEGTTADGKDETDPNKAVIILPSASPKELINILWSNDDGNALNKELKVAKWKLEEVNGVYKEPTYEETTIKIDKSVKTILAEKFKAIRNAIEAGTPLNDEQKKFISSAPLPVADILNIDAATNFRSGDAVYEFVSLLMINSFVDELFREFGRSISIYQLTDKDFVNDHRQDIETFNRQIVSVRTETESIMRNLSEQLKDNIEQLDSIKKVLINYYGTSDMFNYGSGK